MINKKVLVLGGAGFIGSHLCEYLLSLGYSVVSIGRGNIKFSHNNFKHFSCDITKDNLVHFIKDIDISAIINCAGSGSVSSAYEEPLVDFEKTTYTTACSLDFLREYTHNAKFIQLSSAAVYGNVEHLPITVSENQCKPISIYGYNNLLSEKIVDMYSNIYQINSCIIRIFSVYGNGLKKQILWDALNKLSHEKAVFFGSGNEIRDFIHISDLVASIECLLQYAKSPTVIYNCASGVGIKIKDIVELLKKYSNSESEIIFNGKSKKGDPLGFIADIKGTPIVCNKSLESGLKNYVEWFNNNGK